VIKSVTDAFATYLSRIELNPTRVKLASERYAGVKGVIEGANPEFKVKQIGSFQRRTKIRPLDMRDGLDVDALVVIGEAKRYSNDGVNTVAAQDRVLRALRSNLIYRVMKPEKDAPTVVLEYEDPDGFKIELVPAFIELTGKYPRPGGLPCYIVPGENGAWKPADYDYDAQVITGANQSAAVQGSLVPIIKMAKMFFRRMELDWKSFHVETLAAVVLPRILRDWEAKNWSWGYPEAFAGLLSFLPELMTQAVSLPGSFSPPVASGIQPHLMANAVGYVRDRANAAWKIMKTSDEREALEGWRTFFGDPFPAA
jgi:hypothetical protein